MNKNLLSDLFLKTANFLLNLVVILCLTVTGAYAIYALWDNNRIYAAADNVQEDMIKLKPVISDEDNGASFEELLAINSDVCAWVTLDQTKIDYPVLQGETNLTYINQDVYGQFALAGSIYLDSRNQKDFSDAYSLLYGHHMENGGMFGDLDLYKEKSFFEDNSTGMLILPDRVCNLKIFACLLVDAGNDEIFDTEKDEKDMEHMISYVRANSLYLREEVIASLKQMENPQVLAFSTCSSEFTDARTIVLAVMEPYQAAK